MALRDQACYTLELQPSQTDSAVTELVEVAGVSRETRYARVRESREGEGYSAALYDYLTAAKLASTGYETDKVKKRRLQLHGPDEDIPFDFTGKINFEWTINFLGSKFRWTREVYGRDYVCAMDRRPDPKVEVCLARAADKNEPGRVQILHYNIERFPNEITDLRGLESLLVLSFMCFVDHQDDRWRNGRPPVVTASSSSSVDSKQLPPAPSPIKSPAPEPDYEPEDPNEIVVGLHTDMDGHIARATALLQDPKILFIVIRTRKAEAVQRALQASLGVKRWRHSECLPDLHQYVHDEDPDKVAAAQAAAKKGPKVINLDDPPPAPKRKNSKENRPDWKAPQNIAIYLSKIELPDLDPNRRRPSASAAGANKPTPPKTAPSAKPAPASARPPVPTGRPDTTASGKPNGKTDDPAKLSKKPNKVFTNPFSSSNSAQQQPATPAAKPASAGNTASPPAMPGAWAPSARPPPPAVPASRPPPPPAAASNGNGTASNGGSGGGQRLSALQKLVQISRK